ncbi:hypothetical protein CMV_007666 [Castanea mollissima]|uniref:EF-hand domain-containing protein n=1 Tax=Castanea mollissima TaxID=60419 RepID=A0A8J4W043_9ROSI|nr:hypothetical protein CMV_007666 [Castanea mollissima]
MKGWRAASVRRWRGYERRERESERESESSMATILASHSCYFCNMESINQGRTLHNAYSCSISAHKSSKFDRSTHNPPRSDKFYKFDVKMKQTESVPSKLVTNGRAVKMVPASEVMKRKTPSTNKVDVVNGNGSRQVVNGANLVRRKSTPSLVKTPRVRDSKELPPVDALKVLPSDEVGGVPSGVVGVTSSVDEEGDDGVTAGNREETGGTFPQKLASGIHSIPLSNVERLRSTLSTVSLTELIELVPQLGRTSTDYPDKKKLFSVQDFFRYTEAEGRRFFEELDRDGDGQVNLEDLEVAFRKRKLPRRYANKFMRRTRSHIFSKSFGWKQFLSLMEQKEPTILRAYTSLCLSKSGTLQKSEILASLKNAGLPSNEDHAVAMMRFLNADTEGPISYGHFRNFMLLLPSDRLQDDPRSIWFEAATVVAVAPPVQIPAASVLRSALAGGLSCALSCSLMHPVDTIKTRVQASTLTFPEIISKLPQIGIQGLYRGSIPTILGQFSSHGLRTGIFEASKLVLINVSPTLPDIQCSTKR